MIWGRLHEHLQRLVVSCTNVYNQFCLDYTVKQASAFVYLTSTVSYIFLHEASDRVSTQLNRTSVLISFKAKSGRADVFQVHDLLW